MGFNLIINGIYWGYNPLTSHLLSSWDIQVPQTTRLFFFSIAHLHHPSFAPPGGPLAGHQLGLQAGGRGPASWGHGIWKVVRLGGLSQDLDTWVGSTPLLGGGIHPNYFIFFRWVGSTTNWMTTQYKMAPPKPTIFVDLSLVENPFTTMVFHRVCWGKFTTL